MKNLWLILLFSLCFVMVIPATTQALSAAMEMTFVSADSDDSGKKKKEEKSAEASAEQKAEQKAEKCLGVKASASCIPAEDCKPTFMQTGFVQTAANALQATPVGSMFTVDRLTPPTAQRRPFYNTKNSTAEKQIATIISNNPAPRF